MSDKDKETGSPEVVPTPPIGGGGTSGGGSSPEVKPTPPIGGSTVPNAPANNTPTVTTGAGGDNHLATSEIDSKFKIVIYDTKGTRVEAPLPDEFGFTFGSEYSTPFDTGAVSGMFQKIYALGGISRPSGIRMDQMFAGPEQSEISFPMVFDAHFDARKEVLEPVYSLVSLGLGSELNAKSISEKVSGWAGAAGVSERTGEEILQQAQDLGEDITSQIGGMAGAAYNKALSLIRMVNAPEIVSIDFGDIITIDNAAITSTAVTFSNAVDSSGVPIHATVDVTCIIKRAPVQEDVDRYFKLGGT